MTAKASSSQSRSHAATPSKTEWTCYLDPMPAMVQGVIPILHTPYREDGTIDRESLRREVDWVFATGADGCGIALASDILRMAPQERIDLFGAVVKLVGGRGPVVASVGAETAEQAELYARAARAAGAAALMAIPPRERALSEPELERYFERIALVTPLPMIVQDASGYVGKPMNAEFQAGLMRSGGADKVWFKPEANPVGPLISRLRELTEGRARIFEGSGGVSLIENWRRGIAGTMPGCDLLDAVVPLWKALQAGNEAEAYRLWLPVAAIAILEGTAGLDGYIAIERYIMMKRGIFSSDRMRGADAWTPDGMMKAEIDRLLAILRTAVGNEG